MEAANAKYKAEVDKNHCKKVFTEDDLLMPYLLQSCFLNNRTKLVKCNMYHFKWPRRSTIMLICMLMLPDNWNTSHIFNGADLFEYHPDDEELYKPNSRMSSFPSAGD